MGLFGLIFKLILLPFRILEIAVEILLWPFGLIFGSSGGCPNCGSNKIQQLPSGGHQCKKCGYAE